MHAWNRVDRRFWVPNFTLSTSPGRPKIVHTLDAPHRSLEETDARQRTAGKSRSTAHRGLQIGHPEATFGAGSRASAATSSAAASRQNSAGLSLEMDPMAGLQAPLEQLALAVGRRQRELERLTRQCQEKMDEVRVLEQQLQRAVGSAADPESWPLQQCCAGCGKEFWLRRDAAAYPYVVVPLVEGSAVLQVLSEQQLQQKQSHELQHPQTALLPPDMHRIPVVPEHTTRGKTRTCSCCGKAGHSRARCPVRFPQTTEP